MEDTASGASEESSSGAIIIKRCQGIVAGDEAALSSLMNTLPEDLRAELLSGNTLPVSVPKFRYNEHAGYGYIDLSSGADEIAMNGRELVKYTCAQRLNDYVDSSLTSARMYGQSSPDHTYYQVYQAKSEKLLSQAVLVALDMSIKLQSSPHRHLRMLTYYHQNPQYNMFFRWWNASLQMHKALRSDPDPDLRAAAEREAAVAAAQVVMLERIFQSQERHKADIQRRLR